MKKVCAFPWYGGKYVHLKWLLPKLPKTEVFVDVFGGSASVILNKEPSNVNVYNDLESEVTNFFRMLRGEYGSELIKLIGLTPYSREEFVNSLHINDHDYELERARKFYVKSRQCFGGGGRKTTPGSWSNTKREKNRMNRSIVAWLNAVNNLDVIKERLLQIQIENLDCFDLIKRYDSEKTLLYCDPTYFNETLVSKNPYVFNFTENDHYKLHETLMNIDGFAAVSGYNSRVYNELYEYWNKWERETVVHAGTAVNGKKAKRIECLWTNYVLDSEGKLYKPRV